MKTSNLKLLQVALISFWLTMSTKVLAQEVTALPEEPQEQSEAAESVQPEVDKQSTNTAAEKRKKILADATAALDETTKALKALDEENPEDALAALEKATGKLELILARDPALALAPVDLEVVTYDLLANPDTVKAMIHDAENYLEDGEIQKARPLVANLASEIQFRTTSIPLATYPSAIKAVTPLIDEGKLDEARAALQSTLNTLVVSTDEIVPLPKLRAEQMLQNAEALAENEERTDKDNEALNALLAGARNQLKMADLLGYGGKASFAPMYEQLDQIEAKTSGGEGGKGWFDRIKQQLSELL
jgi:hypothetical protein